MDNGQADILDQCLKRIDSGATVEECLMAFPGQSGELEQALRVAAQIAALPRPAMPAATRAALETQMLAAAAARRAAQATNGNGAHGPLPREARTALTPTAILAGLLRALGYRGPLGQPWVRVAAMAATIVLALVLSAGTYAAARAIVEVISPPPTPTATPEPTAIPAPISVDGPISALALEGLTIGDTHIVRGADTAIEGELALGAMAHVSATRLADGTLLALRITVEAQPTAVPTTPATAVPATQATAVPTAPPTAVPTAQPTAVPTVAAPTAAPTQAAPSQGGNNGNGNGNGGSGNGGGDDKTCQGQQLGRDEKKCDPKPKPEPPKENPKPPEQPQPPKDDPKPPKPAKKEDKPKKK
jgi:hypothetical protein